MAAPSSLALENSPSFGPTRHRRPLLVTVCCLALPSLPTQASADGLFEQALKGDLSSEEGQEAAAEGAGQSAPLADTDATSRAQGLSYELGGYVRGDLFVGKDPNVDAGQVKTAYAEAALLLRARTGALADALAELRLRSGLDQDSPINEAELREAVVNLYLGPLDLRLGHQVIVWGRADGFNPTDNLTPRNMNIRSASEDDRRLANFAVRANLSWQPTRVELVWVPFYAPSRLPLFELPGAITLGEPNYPDRSLAKGIGAARIHYESSGIDASVSYLVGHATSPGLELQSFVFDPADPPGEVRVGFSAHRHQVVGADFATTLGEVAGLRGEFAYRRPFGYKKRRDVPRPDLQYVVGVDKELFGHLSIIAQYIGRTVLDWQKIDRLPVFELAPSELERIPLQQLGETLRRLPEAVASEIGYRNQVIFAQQERVSHSASVRLAVSTLHETLLLELVGLYGFTNGDYMLRPRMSYAIADAVRIDCGAELYGGPEETLFGMTEDILSAGFIELKASF